MQHIFPLVMPVFVLGFSASTLLDLHGRKSARHSRLGLVNIGIYMVFVLLLALTLPTVTWLAWAPLVGMVVCAWAWWSIITRWQGVDTANTTQDKMGLALNVALVGAAAFYAGAPLLLR